MDDLNVFERQVAGHITHLVGPVRPVDDAAIFAAITATRSAGFRVRPRFGASGLLVAGVIVAIVGATGLLGQRSDDQDGVAASESSAAIDMARPSELTGAITELGRCDHPGSGDLGHWAGGGAQLGYLYEGVVCQPRAEWSDARLSGTLQLAEAMYRSLYGGLTVWKLAVSIENEEGGWLMQPLRWVEFPGSVRSDVFTWVLEGQGAYEGLVAVLQVEGHVPHDLIDASHPTALSNLMSGLASGAVGGDWPGYQPRGFIIETRPDILDGLPVPTDSLSYVR
jgi:hypothetical protein